MSALAKTYETSFNTTVTHKDNNEDEIDDKVAEVTSLLPVSCENLLEASLPSLRSQQWISSVDNVIGGGAVDDDHSPSSPHQCLSEHGTTNGKKIVLHATTHECDNSKDDDDATLNRELPPVDYRCTPPSTAPLPMKFHLSYKKLATPNSIRSDTDLINSCDSNDPCRLERYNTIKQSGTNLTDKSDLFSDSGEKSETQPSDEQPCSNDECPQKHGRRLVPTTTTISKQTSLSRESVENDNAISTSDYSSASRITLYVSSHGSDPSICKLCHLNTQSALAMGKHVLSPISDKSQEATNEPPMTVLQKNVLNNSIQPSLQQRKSNLRLDINSFKNIKPRLGLSEEKLRSASLDTTSVTSLPQIKPSLTLSFKQLLYNNTTVDDNIPLECQQWYHGNINRAEAENLLKNLGEGSFLVRTSDSGVDNFLLSLKSAKGFLHLKIYRDNSTGKFTVNKFSKIFDSVPSLIRHYCVNRLPIRGAEHMSLTTPAVSAIL